MYEYFNLCYYYLQVKSVNKIVKAVFTDNITGKIKNYAKFYSADVKLLNPIPNLHPSFSKHLNYREFLNYDHVLIITHDGFIDIDPFKYSNIETISCVRDSLSLMYLDGITQYVKCILNEVIPENSITSDMVLYSTPSSFLALFQRIEQFCKYSNTKDLLNLKGVKGETPDFLHPEFERTLFNYFCLDMYYGTKLRYLPV